MTLMSDYILGGWIIGKLIHRNKNGSIAEALVSLDPGYPERPLHNSKNLGQNSLLFRLFDIE